jgi:RNA recognition motif-containing protein
MHIYISNLGDRVTNESLRAVFATYGEVRSSKLIPDGFSDYPSGFAFVEMPNEREALTAMAKLKGSILDGHAIGVSGTKPGCMAKNFIQPASSPANN